MQSHEIGTLIFVVVIVTNSIAVPQFYTDRRPNGYGHIHETRRPGHFYDDPDYPDYQAGGHVDTVLARRQQPVIAGGKRWLPTLGRNGVHARRSESSTCMAMLMQQHPEVCDIIQDVRSIQEMMPQLHVIVENRMGARRFDFKYVANKGKTAMEQLYEVVSRLGDGIKQFIKFLGTAEETFGPDSPFVDIQQPDVKPPDSSEAPVEVPKAPEIADPVPANPQSRRAPSTCESDIESIDVDFCAILARINKLDEVMKVVNASTMDNDDSGASQLAVTIHSSNLLLAGFLDALSQSVLGNSGETRIVDTPGRRYLVNENHEDVAEVFETPNFRVEFVNEDPTDSDFRRRIKLGWLAKLLSSVQVPSPESRSIPTKSIPARPPSMMQAEITLPDERRFRGGFEKFGRRSPTQRPQLLARQLYLRKTTDNLAHVWKNPNIPPSSQPETPSPFGRRYRYRPSRGYGSHHHTSWKETLPDAIEAFGGVLVDALNTGGGGYSSGQEEAAFY